MKEEDFEKLRRPFAPEDIEWRLQQCGKKKDGTFWGKCLAYITARGVQDRLDEVCGASGWQTVVKKDGDTYLCTLSVRVSRPDGTEEWISRTDGAGSTDMEAVKGGISGAVKRAAVQFGIGRYLYNLEENWVHVSENGKFSGKTKEGEWFRWDPPQLPSWAVPGKAHASAPSLSAASPSKELVTQKALELEAWLESDIWDEDKKNGASRRKSAEAAVRSGGLDEVTRHLEYISRLMARREAKERA